MPRDKVVGTFTFDHVFAQWTKQADLYESCVSELVDSFINGYNTSIVTIGQSVCIMIDNNRMRSGLLTYSTICYYLYDRAQERAIH